MNLCSKNCEHVTGCVLLQKTTNFFQTKNNIKGASSDTVKLFFTRLRNIIILAQKKVPFNISASIIFIILSCSV